MQRVFGLMVMMLWMGACASGGARAPKVAAAPIASGAVRQVAGASSSHLWQAAREVMVESFAPLDVMEESRRFAETAVIEWTVEGRVRRTKIAVEVSADPADANGARLGVYAQDLVLMADLERAVDGQALPGRWVDQGGLGTVQEALADQILARYWRARTQDGRPRDPAHSPAGT